MPTKRTLEVVIVVLTALISIATIYCEAQGSLGIADDSYN